NYVFPYESNRIMRDLLVARGCSVLEERYISLNPSDDDIDQIIDEINKLEPDVIFSTVVGEGAIKLYQRYAEKGKTRGKSPIMSLTTGEPEIVEMGVGAAEGHYTCAPYFSSLPRAANQRFVTAYRSAFGAHAPISACTEAAYFQVHLFAEALKLGGPDAILQSLPLVEFDAPQGKVRIDRTTQHTFLTPRIGRVLPSGAFEIVYDHKSTVRPDPYKVEPEASGWSRFVGGA
ncbi:MAG: transporter substrate-binding protein, partial [Pseudomonadota bacterium]